MSAETVFLSYVAEDEVPVSRLKDDLTRAGVVHVDRISARLRKPGIRHAIENASHFILCLSSRDGLPPAFNRDQLATAATAGRPIVSVRFTRCDVPGAAAASEFDAVDLYDDWTTGVQQLISVLPAQVRARKAGGRITLTTGSLDVGHGFMKAEEIELRVKDATRINGTLTTDAGE